MYSMTGYGRGSALFDNLEISVEIQSVNRKNLDANVMMPREWQSLEGSLLSILKESVSRGRIVINIQVKASSDGGKKDFDFKTIAKLHGQLKEMSSDLGEEFSPSSDLLFQLALYSKKNQTLPESDDVKDDLLKAFSSAVNELVEMRNQEGLKLKEDLVARAGKLHGSVLLVKELSADAVKNYRDILMQRLRQADLELDLDDERVLKEIALFADRSDIEEELTRLFAHMEQLDSFFDAEEAIGRKIDFLIQELNREINTVGSKCNDIRISRAVIDFKNELERLREQVANIE